MSFFNKGFSMMGSPVRSFFNKTAGGARSLFNKTPGAFRALSGGLGAASRAIGSAADTGNKLLSDPQVAGLARGTGFGGALDAGRALTSQAGRLSGGLAGASRATNPDVAGSAAASAIEKARSLGSQAKNIFV